jgi:PBP1b-binding outer membrane lipoprotein LpoB
MRISKFALLVLVLVTTVIIVACSGQAAPSQSVAPASDKVQACLAQTTTTSVADVDALIRDRLQNHHAIDRVYTAQHTREEWNVTLDRMIGYGAKISDSEKQIIIDYLICRQQ